MKSRCSPSSSRATYTLVEILVAMSIFAVAIGAASQLSLSHVMAEEIGRNESFAVNYGENAARLWQLGIDDPTPILLHARNSDNSPMTLRVDSDLDPLIINSPVIENADPDGPTTPSINYATTSNALTSASFGSPPAPPAPPPWTIPSCAKSPPAASTASHPPRLLLLKKSARR